MIQNLNRLPEYVDMTKNEIKFKYVTYPKAGTTLANPSDYKEHSNPNTFVIDYELELYYDNI